MSTNLQKAKTPPMKEDGRSELAKGVHKMTPEQEAKLCRRISAFFYALLFAMAMFTFVICMIVKHGNQ
jgi:hypothetical protein